MTLALFTFCAGLTVLTLGAESLVRGASQLARAAGISPLVVGLTVVAFGTSTPELAVSVFSAAKGQTDLAFGNVVGSNIFNILGVLGLSAVVAPLTISGKVKRLEVPLMIGATLALLFVAYDLRISRVEGMSLLAGLVAYVVYQVASERRGNATEDDSSPAEAADVPRTGRDYAFSFAFVVIGLGGLVLGSDWMVDASVAIAKTWGVSDLVIGLTIVAVGTSLPEAATSVMASLRGHRDIAVGNAVGSNIFNIGAVLGASSLMSGEGLAVSPSAYQVDLMFAFGVALACLIFFPGPGLTRLRGAMLFTAYALYVIYLILGTGTASSEAASFGKVSLLVGIPISVALVAFEHRRSIGQKS